MGLLFLHDDARLLEAIRRGDEGVLSRLYRSSRPPVTAYVLQNSGTMDDADDMLQEALVILWERVRTGRFTYSAKLETFVVGTVKNLWLRRLARARRETPGDLDAEIPDPDPRSPLDALVESEEAASLAEGLRRIGEQCRTLLLLFYWEELTMEDIARKMGFANADTAKAKKYQCKKALEDAVREGGSGHERSAHLRRP